MNSNDNDEITKFVIQSYLHILECDPDPTGFSLYRLTGETRHIDIPKCCSNVYSIIGIN